MRAREKHKHSKIVKCWAISTLSLDVAEPLKRGELEAQLTDEVKEELFCCIKNCICPASLHKNYSHKVMLSVPCLHNFYHDLLRCKNLHDLQE